MFGLADWSKGELARLVNREAASMGHPQLSTDTSRVRQRIDTGGIPCDPVPRVLAALFTEPLGRVTTIEELALVWHGVQGSGLAAGVRNIPTVCRGRPNGLPRSSPNSREWTSCSNRHGLVGVGAALVGLHRKSVVGQLNAVGGMFSHRCPEHLQRPLWGVAADLAR